MSLEIDDCFAAGMASSLLMGLETTVAQPEDRQRWKETALCNLREVTAEFFALRAFLGADRSQDDLHTLTMVAAALASCSVFERRVVVAARPNLVHVRLADRPQSFADQVVARWGTHWRSQAEHWRAKLAVAVEQVQANPMIFEATHAAQRLFRLFRTTAEDLLISLEGLLARPGPSTEGAVAR
ncbi:unnamed protein product [Effrenium voratum]|nr:unnamed protein product [Effrenium voratum]